ncbi:RNA polymerase sigma factor [Paraliomyxa miuraensis]|uniref:RNA polymerase sigma factor n=1 Tax=Paraliomyxa miuraensis TaxID=376150 RepID=UPI0022559BA4|nr:sigma-70 family RNA polymerase sigma factor [Paraliomyxa miuraensis]MCX4243878.1 sigma-70 family RNA polymerase sigma factor [Paraliomyxa miuraensis]
MTSDWHVDVALLEAWRAGDVGAGAKLYDRHADVVARFFENKVCLGASDLVQQTFVLLVENRDRIRQGLSFRAFVLGIARNVLRDHIRTLARGRAIDPEVDAMVDLAPGPTTAIGHSREQRLLLAALRRLPLEHQVGLELFYWEDMDAAEIAEVMGISHSAMRSRLAKARALLREAMERLADSPEQLASTVDNLAHWASQIRVGLGK